MTPTPILFSDNAQETLMVTIPEAGRRSKEQNIGLSTTAIRRLVKEDRVPPVMIGIKPLINWQTLMDYINNPPKKESKPIEQGRIRRLERRWPPAHNNVENPQYQRSKGKEE